MKTCICCTAQASADAVTCTRCGEASWSQVEIAEAKNEVPEGFSTPVQVVDPDTAIEVPRIRRGKRPN